MIFREQAVDIHAAAANEDGVGAGRGRDLKGGWGRGGIGGVPHDIESAGLDAACDLCVPLVPVRVQLHSALLHHHPGIVLPGVKGEPAIIEGHGSLLWFSLILVDQAKLQAHRQILLESNFEVAFSLRHQQKVKATHLAAVIRAATDRVVGRSEQLHVGGMPIAQRKEQRLRRGERLLDALEAARRDRAKG